MIKSLLYIIPALVVGILIGHYLSIQDYSKLWDIITLGELLGILINLFFFSIGSYYIVQRSNTDLKRREMLWGYFDELRGKLRDLNDEVMANAERPSVPAARSITRQFKELGIFVSDAKKSVAIQKFKNCSARHRKISSRTGQIIGLWQPNRHLCPFLSSRYRPSKSTKFL